MTLTADDLQEHTWERFVADPSALSEFWVDPDEACLTVVLETLRVDVALVEACAAAVVVVVADVSRTHEE